MKCSNCGICDKDNDFPKILRPDSTHSKDIPEEELANLSDSVNTKLRGKLLVTLNIPPESRFTEPAVIKRLLILAFNSKGVFVDSVSLQSELLHFRGFMFGVEFAILKLRSDAKRLDFEENQNLYDTINRTLEGLVKVTDVVYSATSINDTLANVAKYAFYKLEVYSKIPQQLSKLLKGENEFKEFEQPGGRHRQRKNKKTYTLLRKQTNKKYKLYRGKKLRIVKQLSTANKQIEKNKFCKFIPLIKAIPNQKSVAVYALVPMDVNVYYLIKELAGRKGVTELLRQPLERIVFISDYKSMYKCDCGRYIEITDNGVSVENQLLDTYDHLCVSCLIDKSLI